MDLADAFRDLRNAWFNRVLRSYPHEREWESEEKSMERDQRNDDLKSKFAEQTEAIIRGADLPVAPYAPNDLSPQKATR